VSIEDNLRQYKPNKALLDNKKARRLKVIDMIETIDNILQLRKEPFTKDEIIDEKTLPAKEMKEDVTQPTNAFNSATENIALTIDAMVEEYNSDYDKENLIQKRRTYKKELDELDKDIEQLGYGVTQIENGLYALRNKQRFIIEQRYLEGLEWEEVEGEFEKVYTRKPLMAKRLQQLNTEALKIMCGVVNL